MIIDVHGHYTTAPEGARSTGATGRSPASRIRRRRPRRRPARSATTTCARPSRPTSCKLMKERGSDLTIFSPARQLHGAPHRRLRQLVDLGGDLQRALLSRDRSCSRTTSSPAAMLPQSPGVDPKTCIPELERCVKEYGFVGINLNPDPSGGHWTSPPLTRPPLVPDLREDGGVRHPRDDPRQHQLQPGLPHHRRALPQRRHHGLHAVPDLGPVQGLPDPAVPDPARRQRGALPLGPLPGPGAGAEEAAAQRAPAQQHLLRHLRLPPARHRPAARR